MAVWKCSKCSLKKKADANTKCPQCSEKALCKKQKKGRKVTKSLAELKTKAREYGPLSVSIAAAADEEVLLAVKEARELGIATPLLVGNEQQIRELATKIDFDLTDVTVYNEPKTTNCARRAVELVSSGKAQLLMKGLMSTADILRAVLDKDGLRTGRILKPCNAVSYLVTIVFFPTDGGMNMFQI